MKKLMMLLVLFIQYLYSAQNEELIQLAEQNFYKVVERVK